MHLHALQEHDGHLVDGLILDESGVRLEDEVGCGDVLLVYRTQDSVAECGDVGSVVLVVEVRNQLRVGARVSGGVAVAVYHLNRARSEVDGLECCRTPREGGDSSGGTAAVGATAGGRVTLRAGAVAVRTGHDEHVERIT